MKDYDIVMITLDIDKAQYQDNGYCHITLSSITKEDTIKNKQFNNNKTNNNDNNKVKKLNKPLWDKYVGSNVITIIKKDIDFKNKYLFTTIITGILLLPIFFIVIGLLIIINIRKKIEKILSSCV